MVDVAQATQERQLSDEMAAVRRAVSGAGAAICAACGDEILAARRRAVPWARRCASCQDAAERDRRGGR